MEWGRPPVRASCRVDQDGDRIPDLVAAKFYTVAVLLGNGDLTFQEAHLSAVDGSPRAVVVADMNGDRLPDLVTANLNSNSITIIPNQQDPVARPAIDVRPGDDPNWINPRSRGLLAVAILGSDAFDVAEVIVRSLSFGPDGASPAHAAAHPPVDVDGDGWKDLISHYRTPEIGISTADTELCLTGELQDGTRFEGCDAIAIVGACGLGFELAPVLTLLLLLRRRRKFSGTASGAN